MRFYFLIYTVGALVALGCSSSNVEDVYVYEREKISFMSCETGDAFVTHKGVDENGDGRLQSSEVYSTEIVCLSKEGIIHKILRFINRK